MFSFIGIYLSIKKITSWDFLEAISESSSTTYVTSSGLNLVTRFWSPFYQVFMKGFYFDKKNPQGLSHSFCCCCPVSMVFYERNCKEIRPVHPKGKSVQNIHWKDWCWSWNSNNLATWCKELTHWKRSWCWERLKAGGEGDDRGWDGWMASLTQWRWVWESSRRWWRTRKPDVL